MALAPKIVVLHAGEGLQLLQPVLPGDASVDKDDILILLGDLLERSESSLDTLRYVMALSQTHRVHTLLGNCDRLRGQTGNGR